MPDVLLVDDDDDEHFIFTEATEGFSPAVRCAHARSASGAVGMLKAFVPDIIFVDMNMPGVNGIACIAAIRALLAGDMPPVILYSTNISDALAAEAMAAGASGCLQKPYSAADLSGLLRPFLGGDSWQ